MFFLILGIAALAVLIAMYRSHNFIKAVFLSALQGLTALFSVNFIGDFIGVHIQFNWFSTAVGTVGGLPGIIFLVVNDFVSVLR